MEDDRRLRKGGGGEDRASEPFSVSATLCTIPRFSLLMWKGPTGGWAPAKFSLSKTAQSSLLFRGLWPRCPQIGRVMRELTTAEDGEPLPLKIHKNLDRFRQQTPGSMTSRFKLPYSLPPPCPHPLPSGGRVGDSGDGLGSGRTLFILREIWGKRHHDLPILQKAWFNFPLSKKDSPPWALYEIDTSNPARGGLLS